MHLVLYLDTGGYSYTHMYQTNNVNKCSFNCTRVCYL